jgi:response regulator of citrate/malate metabolism
LIALLEKQFVYIMFPMMTLTAALNLSLIANQESRESQTRALQADKKPSTESDKNLTQSDNILTPALHVADNGRQGMKQARKEVLLTLLQSNSQLSASEAGKMIGVSRQSIYGYLTELESDGLIEKTDEGILVK